MSVNVNEVFPTASERIAVVSRIHQKQNRIAKLRHEIKTLTVNIEQDLFFIAAHRRLPPEVLSEIFIHVAFHGHGKWPAPFVISHVSRHWRDVVMHAKRAWSQICVRITPTSESSLQLVKLWLQRSGSCPLHLHFETPDWGFTTPNRECLRHGYLEDALTILHPHVKRWRSISLLFGSAPHYSVWSMHTLLHQFNFPMPMLESFRLDTSRYIWQDYQVLKSPVPRLNKLFVGLCRPSINNHWLLQLEHLEIGPGIHSVFYIHSLLQTCRQLKTLKLDIKAEERLLPRGLAPIILTCLTAVQLCDTMFLAFVRLPSITSFEFQDKSATTYTNGCNFISAFQSLLSKSENRTLGHLTLEKTVLSRNALTVLRSITTLETLCLRSCPVDEEVIESLNNPTFCPRLRSLQLFACYALVSSTMVAEKPTNRQRDVFNHLNRDKTVIVHDYLPIDYTARSSQSKDSCNSRVSWVSLAHE